MSDRAREIASEFQPRVTRVTRGLDTNRQTGESGEGEGGGRQADDRSSAARQTLFLVFSAPSEESHEYHFEAWSDGRVTFSRVNFETGDFEVYYHAEAPREGVEPPSDGGDVVPGR